MKLLWPCLLHIRQDRRPRQLKWQHWKPRKCASRKSILKRTQPRKVKFEFADHHCLPLDELFAATRRWFLCYHVIFFDLFSFPLVVYSVLSTGGASATTNSFSIVSSFHQLNSGYDVLPLFFLLDCQSGALSFSLLITPSVDLYIYTYSYTYTYRYTDICVCPRRLSCLFPLTRFFLSFVSL